MPVSRVDPREERVLVLAPVGRDATLAGAVLSQVGIPAEPCVSMSELCHKLDGEGAGAVLLVEEALGPQAANCLSESIGRQPPWSDVPLLVFSGGELTSSAVRRTLALIEPLGNVTLLDRPVRMIALVSAIQGALRARRRQYELRDLLGALERAVHERDQFLAMLGHELRNPLAAITYALASIEALGAKEDRTARQRQMISRQTHHLSRLVDDLLDVSRVTSGKIKLNRVPVELVEFVERCVQSGGGAAAAQGHRVTFVGEGAPIAIDADPVRLEQVVVNLLTNARKYTPQGGQIDVRVGRAGAEASIRIEDSGIGIEPKMLPRIFDLFTQVEGALDRAQGGMGIGLTLVRSLVELHGGTVSASSQGLGQGSCFEVRLPLSITAPAGARSSSLHSSAPPEPARRVLIIEDNPDIREMMQMLLEAHGHRVDVAEDGHVGIERVRSTLPEVVLVDIGLPGIDGYEVARAIRAELGHSIYLAALTGYGQPEDRERALKAGFDAHLTKPVTIEAVEQILRSAAP